MKGAKGAGIVSSVVMQSDVLDEIDWEWLGANPTEVQTNYFGKGQTTTYNRGQWHPNPGNQDTFKTYTIDWTANQIVWQIDGNNVRVQREQDAQGQYPQTPMQIKIGAWSGGDAATNAQGTIGGLPSPHRNACDVLTSRFQTGQEVPPTTAKGRSQCRSSRSPSRTTPPGPNTRTMAKTEPGNQSSRLGARSILQALATPDQKWPSCKAPPSRQCHRRCRRHLEHPAGLGTLRPSRAVDLSRRPTLACPAAGPSRARGRCFRRVRPL